MKKLFLIPLMACAMLFSTNLQAEVRTAGTFDELQAALTAAVDGDEIQLTADINYGYNQAAGAINITKSITLNGQGHTLTGASVCAADDTPATIGVNYGGGNTVNATIKDLTLVNANPDKKAHKLCAIYYTNGNGSNSITCDNVVMDVRDAKKGNSAVFQAGGSGTAVEDVTLNNCHLLGKSNDYPVKVFVPLNIVATKSYFLGYCSVYFKPGSNGSALNADECQFDSPNVYSGRTNDFAVFPMEDTGLTFVLNNCSMNAQQLGNQSQAVFCLSEWAKDADRTGKVDITIKGDNTYINCQSNWIQNNYGYKNPTGSPSYGPNDAYTVTNAEDAVHVDIDVKILGGTFSVNPGNMIVQNDVYADGEGKHYTEQNVLPTGYTYTTVTTNQDGEETTLYRVHETASSSDKLDDENITDKNIKVVEDITLGDDVTTKYVEVENGATVTVEAGKTLELTNGLVVNAGGHVVVEAGATVIVGEGGAIAADADGIVIEAAADGVAGNLIMDPEVKLNTTPRVTIRFQSKAYKDGDTRVYHFFGSPMKSVESFTASSTTAKTWLDIWNKNKFDYFGSINDDKAIDYSRFGEPFGFICMSSNNAADALQTYTMTGNLYGIVEPSLKVYAGWSGMANSYMGEIDIVALEAANNAAIDNGSKVNLSIYTYKQQGNKLVWTANNELQRTTLKIAPMQPFMFKNDGDWEDRTLSYENLVWTPATTKSPAPARRQVAADMTKATLRVEAADGLYDMLTVAESPEFSAGKDLYDAEKYMNSDLNFYVTDSEKMNILATDDLDNTYLGFSCIEAGTYTISFNDIEGNTLTLVDLQNNQVIDMTEGATYTFSAAANESNDYRFKLVSRRQVVTDVEEVENAAVRTGVYTLTGQYMGEMNIWNTLPAGIYVVNGEKRVK